MPDISAISYWLQPQHWQDKLWQPPQSRGQAALQRIAQVVYCSIRELSQGDLTLRAMSLVYTTLLALVPLLALSFSLFKALGLHNQIEPMLMNLLQPLGAEAPRITSMLLDFVDNVKIGVLGSIGVAMLFYTVISMIQKVEAAFNHAWKIPRTRPLSQRVSQYLVLLLLGPLAVSLTVGVTASLSSNRLVSTLLTMPGMSEGVILLGRLTPLLMVCAIFSFLFVVIPNTRVRWGAAMMGGLFSGVLWQLATVGFAEFAAGSSNYNAVYSSFAILILLLIWMYIAWMILLLGAQITFFSQNPQYLTARREAGDLSPQGHDALSLSLMLEVAKRFSEQQSPPNAEQLTKQLKARPEATNMLIARLLEQGLLRETSDGGYLPGAPIQALKLLDILQASRNPIHTGGHVTDARYAAVTTLASELEQMRCEHLAGRSLEDLLRCKPD
nr:YihY/virulence factor BrkB family protein [Oceanococcus sp. HetDA_MAG_MS8]